MYRVAVAGVRVRRLRSVLLAGAVMLGVGILGGSLVYGDTATAAFYDDLARAASGVDVLAHPPAGATTDRGRLDRVARLAGVAQVDERLVAPLGLVGRRGRLISNADQVGLGMAAPSWPGFAPYTLSGREPRTAGEALIDEPTAAREGMREGDSVTVLDARGSPHRLTVVGLADFGVSDVYADTSVVVLRRDELVALTGAAGGDIVVAARPGTDVGQLRERVAAALGDGFEVVDGDTLRQQLAVDSAKYVGSFLKTLRVTSIVALAVALLVVYNAFQIMVMQRAAEHALLRAIGATRRQIVWLITVESLLIGGVAGIGSVLVSVGAGWALLWGQELLGGGIPDFGLVVSPLAIVAPALAGLTISLLSGVLPALSAARVSPLAALRAATDPAPLPGATRWRYWLTGAAVAGCGALGALVAWSGVGQGFDGLPRMAAGGMIIFAALVLVLPLAVTAMSAPLRLLGRAVGPLGRVAVANARRHPVRFAATTAAVMVGIAPMTAFAILLTTARVHGDQELAENFPVDFVVRHPAGVADGPFPPGLADRLRRSGTFATVAVTRVDTATGDGDCCYRIGTAEPGVLGGSLAVEVRRGALAGLAAGTAAVSVAFAIAHDLDLGAPIAVGADGRTWTATVVATFDNTPVAADILVNWADFAKHGLAGEESLLLRRAETATAAAARTTLEGALAADPLAVVSSTADRRESLTRSLGRRLVQFNVLLGFSFLIATLGIANTLSLSVLERTRETATLRAVGLSRRQTYGMLLIEAGLIAVAGGLLGVVFGVGFGWVLARDLLDTYGEGNPDIPVATIAAYLALTALAAALASILPARRAARDSITAAIGSP